MGKIEYRPLKRDPHITAKEMGVVCVVPREDELTFDLDDMQSVVHFHRMNKVLMEGGMGLRIQLQTVSPGGNIHIYATSYGKVWDPTMKAAIQSTMGSDRTREALSLMRHCHRMPFPWVLFETPETVAANPYLQREAKPVGIFTPAIQSVLDLLPF